VWKVDPRWQELGDPTGPAELIAHLGHLVGPVPVGRIVEVWELGVLVVLDLDPELRGPRSQLVAVRQRALAETGGRC